MIFWLTLSFIISQILVGIAILTDFISFQFKDRKYVLLTLTFSSLLITLHYFLLWEVNAEIILSISFLSFLVSSFSHDKRWMYLFLILYLIPIVFNYSESRDLILFFAMYIILIWKFQSNDKIVRLSIMLGTSFVILYNVLIFTPMWVILEVLFFSSNAIGYIKHYGFKDLLSLWKSWNKKID